MSGKKRKQKPVYIEEVPQGTKVIASDPDWKYVNVRRRLTYIEKSIDEGTQWVIFEPNGEPLWETVRRVVSAFLMRAWKDGALVGQKASEAFFVKCDRTTMTQDDIDHGRLAFSSALLRRSRLSSFSSASGSGPRTASRPAWGGIKQGSERALARHADVDAVR